MGAVGTVFETKEISMKIFRRWFANMCREAWENARDEPQLAVSKPSRIIGRDQDWQDNLNIAITTATGGKIVTFRRYDHRTDRSDNRVYVIPDDEDFHGALSKMITLESMRG